MLNGILTGIYGGIFLIRFFTGTAILEADSVKKRQLMRPLWKPGNHLGKPKKNKTSIILTLINRSRV